VSGSTGNALRRAFLVAPALSKGLGLTLALAVVGTALQLVVPITIQRIIDSVLLSSGVDTSGVIVAGVVALVAIALAMWARRASLARLARSSVTGLTDLRVTTFAHLHRLSMLHVQAERRGALVSRV
jgi:ATP-binding cassette subfamily B protein